MYREEIMVENYMQALLHAALLLGDPQRCGSVCGITVSAVYEHSGGRLTYPRCRILVEPTERQASCTPQAKGEYIILYPMRILSS